MIRLTAADDDFASSLPRTRGDDPNADRVENRFTEFAPHARG